MAIGKPSNVKLSSRLAVCWPSPLSPSLGPIRPIF